MKKNLVGEFLCQQRTKIGMTQQEVAKKLKYSTPQFISNWERGLALPPLDILPTLVRLYHMDSEALINVMMKHQEQLLELQRKNLKKILKLKAGS